ncbi:hypothetical protein E1293_23120 [Actinomadura darangshiensis]|uniref:Uncharacterized protein n=1 Tax=Actinomadura darangshiensis TaxID=705336 RepID=A0A4R5B1K2_9ACTN|nr:hypothetical protein [Actinomadura darangshiensis]TDD79491.1 hypothetical protein E1293_23120 [Actinomadura darangshiensis]
MSDHTEPGRLDERTAEHLLDGADGHALHALLAAAAAPGRPAELAGEDAAVAAFLAAPRPARRARAAGLRRFLTAKIIAVLGGGSILLSGGVAYATGNFPGQSPEPAPSPSQHRHEGTNPDSIPATHGSPDTGSTPTVSPSGTPKRQKHGKATAPGQQKKTANPNATKTPPRGSENSNGSPPGSNSGNGNGNSGNGNGNNGNGNGNGNGNSGNGNEKSEPQTYVTTEANPGAQ